MILLAEILGLYILIGIILLISVVLYFKSKSPNYIKSLSKREKFKFAKEVVLKWVVLLFQFTKYKIKR